jgi:hypothetical protein
MIYFDDLQDLRCLRQGLLLFSRPLEAVVSPSAATKVGAQRVEVARCATTLPTMVRPRPPSRPEVPRTKARTPPNALPTSNERGARFEGAPLERRSARAAPLTNSSLSLPARQSIMQYNGGCCVAMAGKDCFAIASDRRFGQQQLTVSCDFSKVPRPPLVPPPERAAAGQDCCCARGRGLIPAAPEADA